MLIDRIRKRVNTLELGSYEAYCEHLKSDRTENQSLINLITTNETYFYRTPRVWNFLENEFLPSRLEMGAQNVSIWSAAASRGDEAHTIAIFCQAFRERHPNLSYRVLGTDISQEVVSSAQKGIYKGRSIQRFRATRNDLFSRYMAGQDEEGFRVTQEVKKNI